MLDRMWIALHQVRSAASRIFLVADIVTPIPSTAVSELGVMLLVDDEVSCVIAVTNAVDDRLVQVLKPRGASLRCRIELVAAILVGAIDHGHAAAVETGQMEPEAVMGLVVDLVGRRAMEIWGQGGAYVFFRAAFKMMV